MKYKVVNEMATLMLLKPSESITNPAGNYISKLTKKSLEQGVKYVQS